MTDATETLELSAFLAAMPPAPQEGETAPQVASTGLDPMIAYHRVVEKQYNRMMGVEGWAYRNIEYLTDVDWNDIIKHIGAKNFKIVALTGKKHHSGESFRRGSVLVSPEGMKKWMDYAQRQTKASCPAQSKRASARA